MAGIDETLIVQESGSAKAADSGVVSLALVARVHGMVAVPVAHTPIAEHDVGLTGGQKRRLAMKERLAECAIL